MVELFHSNQTREAKAVGWSNRNKAVLLVKLVVCSDAKQDQRQELVEQLFLHATSK
jgi:hypothetical protein